MTLGGPGGKQLQCGAAPCNKAAHTPTADPPGPAQGPAMEKVHRALCKEGTPPPHPLHHGKPPLKDLS